MLHELNGGDVHSRTDRHGNGHAPPNRNAAVPLSGSDSSYRSNGDDYAVPPPVADLRNVDANPRDRRVPGDTIGRPIIFDPGQTAPARSCKAPAALPPSTCAMS
ncbi:hypothetical protein [Burkholderia ambifaria]|uniref:hypothetical protein n=1 Tax=Burkholderia ambifaria TaxID=152480 RepID=UPI001589F4ED|nr:hypothetical protein [Burkholderia ambifaria]WAS56792.1 hypothetical protein MK974_27330 [Burkholderia ambifaria]WDR88027.1 hypothetical protein OR986_05415 [Burkholderia ambifaria]WDS00756.1 hypothetical protein OR985_10365 [Burkholderia ambifaria]